MGKSIFCTTFTDRFRTVYFNLENKSLIEKINTKKIKVHEVAFMTHQEMIPEKWDELIRLKEERAIQI